MITTTGLSMVRALLISGNSDHISYFAIGSGTTVPTINDTALGSEWTRSAIDTTALGSPTVGTTFAVEFNSIEASGVGNITEAGLFTQSSDGSMFSRATFDAITLSEGSEWKFEWDVEVV
jgi:hypothetical protein